MKIKEIHISNFRCFETYEINLGENTSILIGKNGSGKTSLIIAIKSAISFIFSKYKGQNQNLEVLSTTPDLHLVNLARTDPYYDQSKRSYKYPISVRCIAESDYFHQLDGNNLLDWKLKKNTPNGKLLVTEYRDALLSFLRHYNDDLINSEIPVLAYFSDSYPHKKLDIRSYAKNELQKQGPLARPFGYYMWDAEASCSDIWQNRYVSTYSIVNDYKSNPEETDEQRKEIDFIDKRIIQFTQALRSDLPDINKEFEVTKVTMRRPFRDTAYIQFHFSDGREIIFDDLPQGYKRLLSIVFDLSYRSYILNGEKEPHGIVLIDELELHLHPSLQQEVLLRFKKAFPNIQFIVSTHSPLVISNLKTDDKKDIIIKLWNEGLRYTAESVNNVYGIDYNTNLIRVMDTWYRPSTVDKLINAYLVLMGKNKAPEAAATLDKLKEYLGGNISELLQKEIDDKLKSYL